jgi:polysaccharide pyruvyl transferase WcaK-like protein
MTSVVFGGYYGMQNLGDDAFCIVSAWGARHFWNTSQIDFLSRTLPIMPCEANTLLFSKSFFRGQALLEVPFAIIGKSDVIFSGGSLFQRQLNWIRSFLKFKRQLNRIRLGAIGVSIGPFINKEAEREVGEFLKCFSFLVLRDKKSYEYATSLNLPYKPIEGRDLAFLLPYIYPLKPRKPEKCVLGVSLCHYERYVKGDTKKEIQRENRLFETLQGIALKYKDNIDFRFFTFNNHVKYSDRDITHQVTSRLPKHSHIEVVDYSRDAKSILSQLCECRAFLSTRLHGGIFAAAFNIPFILVEYHRKCTDFLDDLGMPSQYRIGDMDCSSEHVITLLSSLFCDNLSLNLDSTIIKAENNFTAVI